MKLISFALFLVVALACLVSWSSAMPQPDPVADPEADPGFRRFGGLGYGGYGYGSRGYGYGGYGYGGYRRSYYG